ncbi:MAG: PD-(D/E)XK nuclease family protein [Deltaproteobacteria bacterium]|nr:PD-(D/E)XK nuclease family protein [Deltaproteobacteria bacterium]
MERRSNESEPALVAPGVSLRVAPLAPLPSKKEIAAMDLGGRLGEVEDLVRRAADPPAIPVDASADIYNVTGIVTWLSCPRRYELLYRWGLPRELLDREPTIPAGDGAGDRTPYAVDASTYGSAFHEAMERWDGRGETLDGIAREVGEAYGVAERDRREIVGEMKAFAKSGLGRRVFQAARAWRELELAWVFESGETVLRGAVDLLVETGGRLVLIDYKTDRVPGAEEERARHYEPQLRLYADAVEAYLNRRPDEALLYFTRSAKPVAVDIREAAAVPLRRRVREFIAWERRGNPAPPPGRPCLRCRMERFCVGTPGEPPAA